MGKGSSQNEYGKLAMIIFCPILCAILILVGYEMAKITVGAVYFHDCSIENMIPIYLIVSALSPILFCGLLMKDEDGNCRTACAVVGLLFNIVWLICGSVWVYPNFIKLSAVGFQRCYGNVTTACLENICNQTLITFSFVTVTIELILVGLWLFCVICMIRKFKLGRK